jgi:hypothetical protein
MSKRKDTRGDVVTVIEGGVIKPGSIAEIEKQIQLLAGFNLSPTAVERYEVVVRGETKVLRKREHPIKFFIDTAKYNVTATDTMLPSERFFRRKSQGRWRDENKTTAPVDIEIKECFYNG